MRHSRTDYLDTERYLEMSIKSINDATSVDWDKLRAKYVTLANDESLKAAKEKSDVVNKPEHYNTGNIECIEAIRESMSPEAYKGYLKGNCLKYLWRYDYKGKPSEDLEKAGWYLNSLIKELA